jgi:hypothetical protein
MDADLRAAYRATLYRFDVPGGELLLQVDRHSPMLQHLLQRAGQPCAAVLTAFNPGSVLQTADSNRRAQAALESQLRARGLPCITGRHEDPAGRWPAERGLLIPGLGRDETHAIAARYGQLAFLWSDLGATPRLIETAVTASGLPPRP